jgi:hypothetical protein
MLEIISVKFLLIGFVHLMKHSTELRKWKKLLRSSRRGNKGLSRVMHLIIYLNPYNREPNEVGEECRKEECNREAGARRVCKKTQGSLL